MLFVTLGLFWKWFHWCFTWIIQKTFWNLNIYLWLVKTLNCYLTTPAISFMFSRTFEHSLNIPPSLLSLWMIAFFRASLISVSYSSWKYLSTVTSVVTPKILPFLTSGPTQVLPISSLYFSHTLNQTLPKFFRFHSLNTFQIRPFICM